MDIRNLIGIEITEQGKLLRITDAAFEDENIVLTTETVEKDAKELKKRKWYKWIDSRKYLTIY